MESFEIHEYLLSLDAQYSAADEMPDDFPYDEQIKRIRSMCSQIEKETGMKCKLDDRVQDAYYFAEIEVKPANEARSEGGTSSSIRFSSFGSMAAIDLSTRVSGSGDRIAESLQNILTLNGFIPVCAKWLSASEYDGIDEYFIVR